MADETLDRLYYSLWAPVTGDVIQTGFVRWPEEAEQCAIVMNLNLYWGEAEWINPTTGLAGILTNIEVPDAITLSVDAEWILALPFETQVYQDGTLIGTSVTSPESFSFGYPAVYEMKFVPPPGWRPATTTVTVIDNGV
jgi:hypothetical protein